MLHKVLVVDDNPIIQRAVYFALRDKGCSVLMCGDVTGALGHIRREQPEVIVMDINFPPDGGMDGERDGFWALNWIRQVKETQNTPVIMISSDDPVTARPRALAAGAVAYLQKPVDNDELARLVLELIAERSKLAVAAT
ncbi:MAG: response regulator [Verrucomicrobiae bacterium]|nr:response regulator [Verrucomicrobiae bacterium]